nr:hypothetical protein [Tanacetum cinerariifolium]
MSQRLRSNFKMINEACYVGGSFEHLQYDCDKMVVRPMWNNSRRKIKTAQAKEIVDSKKRVKKLKRKRRSRTPGMNLFKIGTSRRRSLGEEDASKQGRNLKQRRAEKQTTNQSSKEESNINLSNLSSYSTRSKEVFKYILLVKIKLLIKNLMINNMNIKFRGGLMGLKDFLVLLKDKKLKIYSFGNHKLHKALQVICEKLNQQEQAANDPENSLIMGDDDLSTIPEKETNEVIKYSIEDLVLILCEFDDTSENDSECDLPSCDDFSPIDVPEGRFVTLSNPLFVSNDDFTSSDDESLSDEDVLEDNVKIYSKPLFEFDNEYISSDVNPLFDEVLENIKNKDSYLDEPDLLVTPLSDANEGECLDPGGDVDEIELLLHHDPSTLKMSVASILEGFTNESSLEENDDLFNLGVV